MADTCIVMKPTGSVSNITPHPPEDQTLELLSELPLASFKYDPLVDVLTARYVGESSHLSAIHFGLLAAAVQDKEVVTLIYSCKDRGELITMTGECSIVTDQRLKDYYWRARWGSKDGSVLVSMRPKRVTLQSSRKPEDSVSPMVCERRANQWIKL